MSDAYNWTGGWVPPDKGSSVPPPFWFTFSDVSNRPKKKPPTPQRQIKFGSGYSSDSREAIRKMIRQELAEIVQIDVPDAPPES